MTTAVLTQDGQLTLPQEIRNRLGVRQGDRVELRVGTAGSVVLRPVDRSTAAEDYLNLCHGVYEGLSEEDVDEIEAVALDRSHFRTRATLQQGTVR